MVGPGDGSNGIEAPASEGVEPRKSAPGLRGRLLALAGAGVVLAILLYYPVGAWRAHVIDDDPTFAPAGVGGSAAVAMASGLIHREVDRHGWTPNKPVFLPASILVAMPNFQMGISATVARFAAKMSALAGRGEEGQEDADLTRAANLLGYSPTVWMIDPATPLTRVLSTEKQYRNGARSLAAYNERLAAGTARLDRRPAALADLLSGMVAEMDAAASLLDGPIASQNGWFSRSAEAAFYGAKGRAYGLLMLLRTLRIDYETAITARGLDADWTSMDDALAAAALPNPWLVADGGPEATFTPNHLALIGYHLATARRGLARLAEGLR